MKALKKIILAVVLYVLASPCILASDETTRLTYDFKNFDSLDISWVFDVTVTADDTYSVELTVTSEVVPYLDIAQSGSKLVLATKGLPKKLTNQRNWNPVAKVKISMPALSSVSISGAAKILSMDQFTSKGNFSLECSGASKVNALHIDAARISIESSGASKFKIYGKADIATFELSGATKGLIELTADAIEIDASGAANLKATGAAKAADIDCSGACNTDLLKTEIKEAKVNLSGASKCQIAVKEKLSVELSGASKLSYEDAPGLAIKLGSISHGASVSKL